MAFRLLLFPLMAFAVAACQSPSAISGGSGVQYPAANLAEDTYHPGPDWQLVWADEFKGNTLDAAKWRRMVVPAGRFNDEWQRYTDSSENAWVEDDCLIIRAIHESDTHGADQYTSARLHTPPEDGWRYGKIAARIQLPHGKGLWPAFWMLGSNIDENGGDTPWPQSGEIDILEMYGSKDDGAVEANMHYADESGAHANMGAVRFELDEGKFADSFHVFELEWDKDSLQWFVDGQRFAAASIEGPEFSEFHEKFFILLNVAVGGEHAGRPDDSTTFPQTMYVDWVRVYQRPERS